MADPHFLRRLRLVLPLEGHLVIALDADFSDGEIPQFACSRQAELHLDLIVFGDTEICKTYPGLNEYLCITAEAEAFVKWHAGQLTWAQATHEGRIQLDGSLSLVRAFPTWNARSMFADIKPVSRTATSPAG